MRNAVSVCVWRKIGAVSEHRGLRGRSLKGRKKNRARSGEVDGSELASHQVEYKSIRNLI